MIVALYGRGRMGSHHYRHLAELGHDVRVVDPQLSGEPEGGGEAHLAGVEAVVVATPTLTHVAVARPWLERGVPVLVEKPLAPTVAEAEALAGYPHCYVGHIERFNPALAAFAGLDARFVQAERLSPWVDRGIDVDVVLDLMVHDLDLFWSLTRSPLREVRANGLSLRSGGIDIVHARVETEGGHVGVFAASRLSRKPARVLRVFSPEGYVSADLRAGVAVRIGANLEEEMVPVVPADALRSELIAFLAAARGEGTFPVSGSEAMHALRMAEAVRCACS